MTNLLSNAFDSVLKSIYLKSSILTDYNLNILSKNTECQFNKLEMEESVFEIFPIGCITVRDTNDIVSLIQSNKIDTVDILFTDGTTRRCGLISTTYINNAASDKEENFVALHITNNLYKISQKYSASDLLTEKHTIEDRVYKLEELITGLDKNLTNILGGRPGQYVGSYNKTDNFFCLKMLNAGNHNLNYSVTDSAFQYMNYISSLAVDVNNKEPRFLFWTTFDDYFYFKYFPIDIINEDASQIDKYNLNNYRYGIYDGDVPFQTASNGKKYKKIYSLKTDPTNQFVSKNYFYIRKTPKFLDSLPAGISVDKAKKYTTANLSYHFQDDGEKYNIEAIASSGIINGVTSGSDEFFCSGEWGWISDSNTINKNAKEVHNSGEYGMGLAYSKINYMGNSGYFSRTDNTEMWKNMFDMTEIHPDYPRGSTTQEFYYNSIQKNLTTLYKGNSYTTNTIETLRKIEKENFLLYALCCINDSEQTFFANLIRYEPDPYTLPPTPQNAIDLISGVGQKWRYKWEGLQFTNGAGSCYWVAMELWDTDETNKASGATANDTWAINLNERMAGLGQPKYYPPGWVGENGSFTYRPIGCNTTTVNATGATIAHLVKMYKTTAERLVMEGGITMPAELRGKNLYYFTAENIIDGVC